MLGIIPDPNAGDSRVGILITGVQPGSPADQAGLRPGDLLIQFGDSKLRNLDDLAQVLSTIRADQTIAMKVLRGKQSLSLPVLFTPRKEEDDAR